MLILWLMLLAAVLIAIGGCRSADGAHQPGCLYQCQEVLITLPAPVEPLPGKVRR